MAKKPIVVVFDCGAFGKVVWEIPRELFSGGSDADIKIRVLTNVEPILRKVFAFFAFLVSCRQPAVVRAALARLDEHLFNSRVKIRRKAGLQ